MPDIAGANTGTKISFNAQKIKRIVLEVEVGIPLTVLYWDRTADRGRFSNDRISHRIDRNTNIVTRTC